MRIGLRFAPMTGVQQQVDDNIEFAAPTGPKVAKELASLLQVPRLAMRSPSLLSLARGNETVMVFPGWSTPDLFMLPIRSGLRTLGHTTVGWGFGFNTGEVEGMLPSIANAVHHRVAQAGKPIALIGWSLGGVLARETARDHPELVSQVITLATPVFGGPKYTRGARAYTNEYVDYLDQLVAERNEIPIERPITAIYSRADAIVDWRACIDTFSPDVDNIELRSPHVGITIDPDAWEIIANKLASPLADDTASSLR